MFIYKVKSNNVQILFTMTYCNHIRIFISYEDITIFGEGECDMNLFVVLVASRFAVYSGKLHQPTRITGNDITNDIIVLMMS